MDDDSLQVLDSEPDEERRRHANEDKPRLAPAITLRRGPAGPLRPDNRASPPMASDLRHSPSFLFPSVPSTLPQRTPRVAPRATDGTRPRSGPARAAESPKGETW